MIPGARIEHRAVCTDCSWKGAKYGNRAVATAQAEHHEITMMPKVHAVTIEDKEILPPDAMPEMTEHQAKLIFIRQSATEAYERGEIKEATASMLKSIIEVATAASMDKDSINQHLGNLDTARAYLAAFTQGLSKGHAKEAEPRIKAKREAEAKQKALAKVTSGANAKVNALVAMAQKLAEASSVETPEAKKIVSKVPCPKCSKEVFSLKFHKC